MRRSPWGARHDYGSRLAPGGGRFPTQGVARPHGSACMGEPLETCAPRLEAPETCQKQRVSLSLSLAPNGVYVALEELGSSTDEVDPMMDATEGRSDVALKAWCFNSAMRRQAFSLLVIVVVSV